MAYRLIAFDMDGTLFDDKKRIPEENMKALRAAAEKGIILVPATGRMMMAVPESVRALPFIRYYISINGAAVYDTQEDKLLYRAEIPAQRCLEVFEYMETMDILYDCYQYDLGWITESMIERMPEFFQNEPHMFELLPRTRRPVPYLPDTVRERGEGVQKMQMFFKPTEDEERFRQLKLLPELFPDLVPTTSISNNIEINSIDASKGKALVGLCESLGIPVSEAVAIGDGSNDISMLEAAGLGVAMANAPDFVKASADVVTGSNNEAGVAQLIYRLLEEM